MNRELGIAFVTLRLSDKQAIPREMGFGERHAHETNAEFDKRFLTWVQKEGKVRILETLVLEHTKRG